MYGGGASISFLMFRSFNKVQVDSSLDVFSGSGRPDSAVKGDRLLWRQAVAKLLLLAGRPPVVHIPAAGSLGRRRTPGGLRDPHRTGLRESHGDDVPSGDQTHAEPTMGTPTISLGIGFGGAPATVVTELITWLCHIIWIGGRLEFSQFDHSQTSSHTPHTPHPVGKKDTGTWD